MDWKRVAIDDLYRYKKNKHAVKQIKEKLDYLEAQATSLKSFTVSPVPIMGDTSRHEDKLINNIAEREKLGKLLKLNIQFINWIENTLLKLTEEEVFLLEVFYMDYSPQSIYIAEKKLNYSRAHIYRLRNAALRTFVLYQYGVSETLI